MKTPTLPVTVTLPWIIAVQRPRPLRIATPVISSRALPSARGADLSALRAGAGSGRAESPLPYKLNRSL